MTLYIVLHHKDAKQAWANEWDKGSNSIIKTITTDTKVANLCLQAAANHEMVFVHRCTHGEIKSSICCKALVDNVSKSRRNRYIVKFKNQEEISQRPEHTPQIGENCYVL